MWMKRTEKKLQPASSFTLCICIYTNIDMQRSGTWFKKNNVQERSQEIPNKLQYIQLQNPETRKKIKHARMKRPFRGTPSSGSFVVPP